MCDSKEPNGKVKERKVLMQKLQEHLTNLDQIEANLVWDPWNDELHKLKTDINEIIRLISWRMLALKNEKKVLKKSKGDTGKSSRAAAPAPPPPRIPAGDIHDLAVPIVLKDLTDLSATTVEQIKLSKLPLIPELPDFFFENRQTFGVQYPRVEPTKTNIQKIQNGQETSERMKTKETVGGDNVSTDASNRPDNYGADNFTRTASSAPKAIGKGSKSTKKRNMRKFRQKEFLKAALAVSMNSEGTTGESSSAHQKPEDEKMVRNEKNDAAVAVTDDIQENNVGADSGSQKTGVEDMTEEVAATPNAISEAQEIEDHLGTEKVDQDTIVKENPTTASVFPTDDVVSTDATKPSTNHDNGANNPTAPPISTLKTIVKKANKSAFKRRKRRERQLKLKAALALDQSIAQCIITEDNGQSMNNRGTTIDVSSTCQKPEDGEMIGNDNNDSAVTGDGDTRIEADSCCQKTRAEDTAEETSVTSDTNGEGQEIVDHSGTEKKEHEDVTAGAPLNDNIVENHRNEASDGDRKVLNLPETSNKTIENLSLHEEGLENAKRKSPRKKRRTKYEIRMEAAGSTIAINNVLALKPSSNSDTTEEPNVQDDSDFQKKEDLAVLLEKNNTATTTSDSSGTKTYPVPVESNLHTTENAQSIKIEDDVGIATSTLSGNIEGQEIGNGPDLETKDDEMVNRVSHSNIDLESPNIQDDSTFPNTEIEDMEVDNTLAVATLSSNSDTVQSTEVNLCLQTTEDAQMGENTIVSAIPSSKSNCEENSDQKSSELKTEDGHKEENIITPTPANDDSEGQKMAGESGCPKSEVEDVVEVVVVTTFSVPSSSRNEVLNIESDSGCEKKEDQLDQEMTKDDNTVTATTSITTTYDVTNNSNSDIVSAAKSITGVNKRFLARPNLLRNIQSIVCSKKGYKRRFKAYIDKRNTQIKNFLGKNTLVMINGELAVHSSPDKFCQRCQKACECKLVRLD